MTDPSPYSIVCATCGVVRLTWEQFHAEMDADRVTWICPHCKAEAVLNDDTPQPPKAA